MRTAIVFICGGIGVITSLGFSHFFFAVSPQAAGICDAVAMLLMFCLGIAAALEHQNETR